MKILAIDQGTSNTKALVFDEQGRTCGAASVPMQTHYPQSGWAEQDADGIWQATRQAIAEASADAGTIDAIAIANQRETLVVWDSETGAPVGPAPIWQCRRTAQACAALQHHADEVHALTGLGINPLFPASKLAWILENRPETAELHAQGRLRAGTVDAWLIWKLTGGASFATDHSNASRTLLFDTAALGWSARLCEIFDVPMSCLPTPMASDAMFGELAAGATALPAGIPIRAVMGDSHAALYGHGIRQAGTLKATYGTGSSLMMPLAQRALASNGLSTTIAWTEQGQTTHALEGNITVSAQTAAFAVDMLGLEDVDALTELAASVSDTGGVALVPAFAGLGAPHWDDAARGLISGMTLGTTQAHIARAALEAIAHQIADVFEAMAEVSEVPVHTLRADGGASVNDWLMARQADLIGATVTRSALPEVGALGVATMAARALGADIHAPSEVAQFAPQAGAQDRMADRALYRDAVRRARL